MIAEAPNPSQRSGGANNMFSARMRPPCRTHRGGMTYSSEPARIRPPSARRPTAPHFRANGGQHYLPEGPHWGSVQVALALRLSPRPGLASQPALVRVPAPLRPGPNMAPLPPLGSI